MKTYNKENYKEELKDAEWKTYRKKVSTQATKIEGKFEVQTSEGLMHCAGGYLAVDARGYPYPIATAEFELIYDEGWKEEDSDTVKSEE